MIGPESRNLALLRERMEAEDLDAVVAVRKGSVIYLSNAPTAWGWQQTRADGPRICLVVWPREGEPVLVVGVLEYEVTREYSWIERIECYPEYKQTPFEKLVDLLDNMHLRGKRVAIERRAMGTTHWEYLAGAQPGTSFIEAGPLLDAVRAQKTPAEVELARQACRLLDRAFLAVFSSARPGMTELDLHLAMHATLESMGAGDIIGGLLSGPQEIMIHRPAIRRSIVPGDILRTDYVATFESRAANMSRVAVVGNPSKQQKETYQMLRELELAVFDKVKPGMRACDLHAFYLQQIGKRGLAPDLPLLGHGIGIENHEAPMIVHEDTGTLEAGMVICVEPFLLKQYQIQDQLHITQRGVELLSGDFDTSEMFVID